MSESIEKLLTGKLKTAQGSLAGRVADTLADREIDRRVGLLVAGWDRLETLQSELKKIDRPDMKLRGPDNAVTEFVSEQRHGQIQKAKSSVGDLTSAIDIAIAEGQFEKLEKLLKSAEPKKIE